MRPPQCTYQLFHVVATGGQRTSARGARVQGEEIKRFAAPVATIGCNVQCVGLASCQTGYVEQAHAAGCSSASNPSSRTASTITSAAVADASTSTVASPFSRSTCTCRVAMGRVGGAWGAVGAVVVRQHCSWGWLSVAAVRQLLLLLPAHSTHLPYSQCCSHLLHPRHLLQRLLHTPRAALAHHAIHLQLHLQHCSKEGGGGDAQAEASSRSRTLQLSSPPAWAGEEGPWQHE